MGSPAQAPVAGAAKSAAQAGAYARQSKGELVHISDVKGKVLVRRPGRFEWEQVGPEGLTVHQGAEIKTAVKARATVTSQSRGETKMTGGSLLRATEIKATGSPRQKLQWGVPQRSGPLGMIKKSGRQPRLGASPRPRPKGAPKGPAGGSPPPPPPARPDTKVYLASKRKRSRARTGS